MRQKSEHPESPSERIVKTIRRVTRKRHSAEEKIRIVLDGLRGESSIAELCRREGIAESLYYAWSKEFPEAGKKRLAGDTARAATSGEVKDLRREAQEARISQGAKNLNAIGWRPKCFSGIPREAAPNALADNR
jgi:transposase